MLYYAKVDYDVANDCKFQFLFCCYSTNAEKILSRINRITFLDPKYLSHLEIIESTEVVDQIPQWFVDYNKERYNGEGVFKDYKPYNVEVKAS